MITKYILILFRHKLLQLVNLLFKLVLLQNVSFNAAGEHKHLEEILPVKNLVKQVYKSEALVVDGSLLLELQEILMVVHFVVHA